MKTINLNHSLGGDRRFSFVMPVRLYDPELDLRRLININLRSIDLLFDKALLGKVLIMARSVDQPLIKEAVERSGLSIRPEVVDECSICPCFNGMYGSGWFRQQVLKLVASERIDTEYMILMDDDVVMTRHVGRDQLFLDNRLVMSHLQSSGFMEYYDSSCQVMQVPRSLFLDEERVMNVTPEIMVTRELRNVLGEIRGLWGCSDAAKWLMQVSRGYSEPAPQGLLARLSRRLGRNSLQKKAKESLGLRERMGNWSEYTLYWTLLKKYDRTGYYYDYDTDPHARQLNDKGVWSDAEAVELGQEGWLLRTFDNSATHCFAVLSARVTAFDKRLLYDGVEHQLQMMQSWG